MNYTNSKEIIEKLVILIDEKQKYQKELLSVASPPERAIVDTFLRLKNGEAVDFSSMSVKLLAFAKKWIDKR